jgi:NADPH-dependent methylglyoxal reductase
MKLLKVYLHFLSLLHNPNVFNSNAYCYVIFTPDVDAIAHVASPTSFNPENPIRDVVNPAINGTISLLQSAHKYGKNVKHVVVTSSVAAVVTPFREGPYDYTEKDWNKTSYEEISQWKEGEPINGPVAYAASKVAAEQALFKFQKDVSPKFTINTILPGSTFGAILGEVKSANDLTGTPSWAAAYYSGQATDVTTAWVYNHYVHVVDVAVAHVRAIERGAETNGERYIITGGSYSLQEQVDILRKHYPERKDIIVEGTPGKYPTLDQTLNGSKAARELGIKYKDFETSMIECADSFKHLF